LKVPVSVDPIFSLTEHLGVRETGALPEVKAFSCVGTLCHGRSTRVHNSQGGPPELLATGRK